MGKSKILHLKRVSGFRGDFPTLGILTCEKRPICLTLEDPWKDNQKNISCIPTGIYHCIRVDSPRFGETFTVLDVPDRSLIRFHTGNDEDDTEGCILVGLGLEDETITSSRKAFDKFMDFLEDEKEFTLIVEEV